MLELDFSNKRDIINPEEYELDHVYRPVQDYTPEYKRSLRVSCIILFFSSLPFHPVDNIPTNPSLMFY